ncbi:FluC/FEX family fluoride channel [Nocardioides sp. AX2bis]|uniref:FluC/FEX family fluoride channel n=1 Tax=Nocardioides sp. AX2bis TaxID=2653157 RepID=UPI0012EF3D75|nr:CrcB family protein [Nocardioides sp. AX2bis]VXC45068.1 Putative fluoride ion transporter CrcB [Nocardioides sp. AX2bis]
MRGPAPAAVAAVAVGGALGCVLRAVVGETVPAGPADFPWAVFAINLVGAAALAALPVLGVVRRSSVLAAGLGPGLLGGFTTLSAVSDQTRALLAADQTVTAAAYVGGSLAVGLIAVHVVSSVLDGQQDEEGDE